MATAFGPSPVTFRTATLADIDIMLRHRRAMFAEITADEDPGRFDAATRQYFEKALASRDYYAIFAELNGEVVAGGGVVVADWPGSPLNLEPRRAWILNIYVEPDHRKQGLARATMQKLIEWCRDNGFQSVALHASPAGRKLYGHLGFKATNEMRLVF